MSFEVPERYTTYEAREALAKRFELPFDDTDQDWEYTAADPGRFVEFLDAYPTLISDDEKFALMMMLVQCVEHLSIDDLERSQEWRSVVARLLADWSIHQSTVQYWSLLDEKNEEFLFRVSKAMRRVWHSRVAESHTQ